MSKCTQLGLALISLCLLATWVNEDSVAPICVANGTMQCVGMPRRNSLTRICICTYLVLTPLLKTFKKNSNFTC